MIELLHLVESSLGSGILGKNGEYSFKCYNKDCGSIYKGRKKLIVNLDKKIYHCWVCGAGGSLYTLFRNVDREKISEYKEIVSSVRRHGKKKKDKQFIVRFPNELCQFNFIRKSKDPDHNNSLKYLYNRGIQDIDIARYNIMYAIGGEYNKMVVFPSYDLNGKLNFIVGRAVYEDAYKKYHNTPIPASEIIFNELLIDWKKPVILTEGPFDAVTAGANAIPILGSSPRTTSILYKKIFLYKPVVYIALDSDAIERTIKIAESLIKNHITVYYVNLNPYNDVSDCGKELFKEKMKNAEKLDLLKLTKMRLKC